jgi:hypothetical protein
MRLEICIVYGACKICREDVSGRVRAMNRIVCTGYGKNMKRRRAINRSDESNVV